MFLMSLTLEHIQQHHKFVTQQAYDLVAKKGADYSGLKQAEGDTLFNMRVAKLLGVTQTDEA